MTRTLLKLLLAGIVVAGFVSSNSTSFAGEKPVLIRLAHGSPETHAYHLGYLKFKEYVEQRTNGRVKVDIFPQGVIPGESEATRMGNIEMCISNTGQLMDYDKRWAVFDLPFLFADLTQADSVLNGKVIQELYGDVPGSNLTILPGFFENGFRHLTNNRRPVRTPTDVKGLKIRTMKSPLHQDMWKAMGGSPTAIDFAELYTSLQTGVVDGQENPIALVHDMGFAEVQKYLTLTGHLYHSSPNAINTKFYNSLPKDIQEALKSSMRDAATYQRSLVRKQNEEKLSGLEKKRMAVVALTPEEKAGFVKASLPVYRKYIDEIGKDFANRVLAEMGREAIR